MTLQKDELKRELQDVRVALVIVRTRLTDQFRDACDAPAYEALATHEMMILNRLSLEDEA